jgi:hypothetical protein
MPKAGRKIMANLKKEYGDKKGKGIFYAMENKGEIPEMNKMKGYAKGGDTKKKKDSDKKSESKTRKSRTDAGTTRKRQEETRSRMIEDLSQSGYASAGIREGMDYGRFPGTAGDRLQTEKENARDAERARSPEVRARRTENQTLAEDRANRRRGMAKGGLVKATGKMNTGIKKCGE